MRSDLVFHPFLKFCFPFPAFTFSYTESALLLLTHFFSLHRWKMPQFLILTGYIYRLTIQISPPKLFLWNGGFFIDGKLKFSMGNAVLSPKMLS